ncbi:MAG: HNH endonuclease [Actinomycetes bacterium]
MRDLKDAGFVIQAHNVKVDGRRMARYTLVDTMSDEGRTIRRPIPLAFRRELFEANDFRCAACGGKFEVRMLQADHRIPFEIGGDPDGLQLADYMPLCGSDNRAKSMSCETCPNWTERDVEVCGTCYWHDPDHYEHLACVPERRVVLTFQGPDVRIYNHLGRIADQTSSTIEETLKRALTDFIE